MLCCLQKKINLTKTVRKLPINDQLERAGHYLYDDRQLEIKYDDPAVRPYLVSFLGPAGRLCSQAHMPEFSGLQLCVCYQQASS